MNIKNILLESQKVVDPGICYIRVIDENTYIACNTKCDKKIYYLLQYKNQKIIVLGGTELMSIEEIFAMGNVSSVVKLRNNILEIQVKKDNQKTIKYIVYANIEKHQDFIDSEVLFFVK